MPKSPEPLGKFDAAKKWILGLTGVLVVIPALLNAVVDIYSSLAKLPKTASERTNVELFQKYFNKQPVTTLLQPIKRSNGTVDVHFSIFDEGDVYVEFGKFTQWFPFPDDRDRKQASLSIFTEANAQTNPPLKGVGNFQQVERFDGNTLVRERAFQNGVTERTLLDPRTGEISEFTARRTPSSGTNTIPPPAVSHFAPIDLDAIRANRPPTPKRIVWAPKRGPADGTGANVQCYTDKDEFFGVQACTFRRDAVHTGCWPNDDRKDANSIQVCMKAYGVFYK